jgi:parallel beta-helix repeat protein
MGANQNGRVVIVTSGTFAEVVQITAANGNVTIEAVPGVEANIDAVLQGDPGSGGRQNAPGIVVDAPANRRVVLRNLVSRNWTEGIRVQGSSFVTIDRCRVENNVNYGIRVLGTAKAVINDSRVDATGYRVGGGASFPDVNTPDPGIGIDYEAGTSGVVSNSVVVGSFGREIRGVRRNGVIQFD